MQYFIKMVFSPVSSSLDHFLGLKKIILETEWAKKFKNNKRLQSMKPIELVGTNLASESGRQAINSFINGKNKKIKLNVLL